MPLVNVVEEVERCEKQFFLIFLSGSKGFSRDGKSRITIHQLWEGRNAALWFFTWKMV